MHARREREVAGDLVAELVRGGSQFPGAIVGQVDMQLGEEQLAGVRVLDPVEQTSQHAEGRRNDTARAPGVHTFGEDPHGDVHRYEPPQRCRQPQPVVRGASRIEADDEIRSADAIGERVDVLLEIGARRLFAGLDEDDAARVPSARLLDGFDRAHGRERGVAVVAATPPEQLVAFDHRQPRSEVVTPADHLGLLVDVAVQQHGLGRARIGRGDLGEDERRSSRQPLDGDGQPLDGTRRHPRSDELDGTIHVPARLPLGIERGRDVGDSDVLLQRGKDIGLPHLVDVVGGRGHAQIRTPPGEDHNSSHSRRAALPGSSSSRIVEPSSFTLRVSVE